MSLSHPILAIESIETGDQQVSAELRIGPRRKQIVLGFSIPGLVEFKRMPDMLESIPRALQAVLDVLSRAYRGEAVHLPVDLSQAVREEAEDDPWQSWPLHRGQEDQAAEPSIAVHISQVERDTPAQGITTVHMTVAEMPAVVMVTLGGEQRRSLRVRFLSGVHPWQLTDPEARAMVDALAKVR